MLLVILSMIGVTVARMQTVEERMARNENNRQLATQAAEAGLRYAEYQLLNAPTEPYSRVILPDITCCRRRPAAR